MIALAARAAFVAILEALWLTLAPAVIAIAIARFWMAPRVSP